MIARSPGLWESHFTLYLKLFQGSRIGTEEEVTVRGAITIHLLLEAPLGFLFRQEPEPKQDSPSLTCLRFCAIASERAYNP